MPFLELFDETLDINATGNYELIIQVSGDCITFCILDSIREKFILIRSTSADQGRGFSTEGLSEIITRDDFLVRQYMKVTLILPSERYTLVPSALFDPARKDEYHSQSFGREIRETILACRLTEPDLNIVYSVDSDLCEMLYSRFPSANLLHSLKPLLTSAVRASGRTAGNYISINCESSHFDISVFSAGSLKFCNSFSYKSTSDILYFAMNVLNMIKAGRDDIINLSGAVSKDDALWSGLSVYFRNVRTAMPPPGYAFSYVFGDVEIQRYMNLFLAPGCA
ncbi:MAG: DUF3822 family protein [Bacteroidales bacterium]|nr:DUF3822 family protein [Bacteroidales bacterium]